MKILKKAIFPLFILWLMIFSEIFMLRINFLKYTDEILAVLFFLYLFYIGIKKKRIEGVSGKVLIVCLILLFLGIISNLFSKQQKSIIAILLDIVANFKLPVICIGFSQLLNEDTAKKVSAKLDIFSRLFLLFGFVLGVFSLFIDLGMRGQYRFGLWGYNFIYDYAHIYALMVLFCLLIVIQNIEDKKRQNAYIIIASVQLILNLKGPSLITAVLLLICPLLIKKSGKFEVKHIIFIGIVSLLLGVYQINNYFLNENAPRSILFKYGIKTANSYFPIGSGFASYGSDMAAKFYSNLYRNYGFELIRGMNPYDFQFLNDNYWPSIIAQFGYIGAVLVVLVLLWFFMYLQRTSINNKKKAVILSCFIYTLIASLGNTIYTTSATILMFLGMMIVLNCNKKTESDEKNE